MRPMMVIEARVSGEAGLGAKLSPTGLPNRGVSRASLWRTSATTAQEGRASKYRRRTRSTNAR